MDQHRRSSLQTLAAVALASAISLPTLALAQQKEVRWGQWKGTEVGEKFMGELKAAFENPDEEVPWQQKKRFDDFDYGYALTVHKAQGSQWNDVVLFDESFAFQDSRARWLYTGITRAAKRLTVVV